ncbi:MAG TPA: hypothetical protein VFJ82_06515 [Longimicrobium sp.]|nr:hypothetical protein [Longimicrobium sp.]
MRTAAFLVTCALLAGAASSSAAQCDLPRAAPAGDAAGPMRYAAGAAWFKNNEPITVYGSRFVKYGLPRKLSPSLLWWIGEYQGVPVYAETGARSFAVIYALVNAGCEFQPYESNVPLPVVRADPAPPPGSQPAELRISGCPKGAHLYILPAAQVAADTAWRSKLVPEAPGYIGMAWYYHVLVFTPTPQPYEVVLAWRGRRWRFRVDAVPGRTTAVDARPPDLRKCEVPDYPVM